MVACLIAVSRVRRKPRSEEVLLNPIAFDRILLNPQLHSATRIRADQVLRPRLDSAPLRTACAGTTRLVCDRARETRSTLGQHTTGPLFSHNTVQCHAFALAQSQAEYQDWVVRSGKTVAELLDVFPSVTLSPDELVDLLPPMTNRFYSIASRFVIHPCSIARALVGISHWYSGMNSASMK